MRLLGVNRIDQLGPHLVSLLYLAGDSLTDDYVAKYESS